MSERSGSASGGSRRRCGGEGPGDRQGCDDSSHKKKGHALALTRLGVRRVPSRTSRVHERLRAVMRKRGTLASWLG